MKRTVSRGLGLASLVLLLHAATPGCLIVDHGIVVELRVSALRTGGASQVALPDGTALTIDRGSITIEDVTLLRCPTIASQASAQTWMRVLVGPMLARAHDHAGGGPILQGPFRVSLVDDATILGVFTPASGRYCALHVNLGPSSDAAEPAWTASARAHAPDGTELTAWTNEEGVAHVVPIDPFDLEAGGSQVVHMSLYQAIGFTGATFDLHDPSAFGEALVRGVTAQGDATMTTEGRVL